MATLSDRDAARWHRVAGRVAEAIEPRLPGNVLANRTVGPWPSWRLRALGPALAAARRRAGRLPGPVVLRTDVADCYPSVRPAVVFTALSGLGVPDAAARAAADLVEGWGSEGSRGLPVGPAGSAVIANAVLASADAAIGPYPFLRWVDDYLVGVPTEGAAVEVVERLQEALARLGLRLAPAKTAIAETGPRIRWLGTSPG
jgi:Reverse transcriptase (RNA-dependent DNA polymerase)